MSKTSASIHAVLNYIITRAVMNGKVGITEVKLPLIELSDSEANFKFDKSVADLALKVTIKTEWVEGNETLITIEDEDDENGEDEDSNKNTTSN
jgi:hypothetical protein